MVERLEGWKERRVALLRDRRMCLRDIRREIERGYFVGPEGKKKVMERDAILMDIKNEREKLKALDGVDEEERLRRMADGVDENVQKGYIKGQIEYLQKKYNSFRIDVPHIEERCSNLYQKRVVPDKIDALDETRDVLGSLEKIRPLRIECNLVEANENITRLRVQIKDERRRKESYFRRFYNWVEGVVSGNSKENHIHVRDKVY